jgi:hypothetical protein
VQVRVSLGGEAFTTTFQQFSFFLITDANNTIGFGPGEKRSRTFDKYDLTFYVPW